MDVPVICLTNQKGGVGKTTTADALVDGMRRRGLKVLAIDADPQGSLGSLEEESVADGSCACSAFFQGARVIPTSDGQATVPGDPDTYGIENATDAAGAELTETTLRDRIQSACAEHGFDAVVIDTHPGLSFATISAILAATHIIVPTIPDRLAVEGVAQTADYISSLSECFELELVAQPAVLITMYRSMTKVAQTIAHQIKEQLPDYGFDVFSRRVPVNAAIQSAQLERHSIYDASVLRGAAFEYDLLVDEVMAWAAIEPRGDAR